MLACVGVVGSLALSACGARAPVRSGTAAGDPQTVYTIRGKTLTISSADPVVLEMVRGSRVGVICYASSNTSRGTDGFGRWGDRASSVTLHLRSDVSKDVGYCEAGGGLRTFFSHAGFTAAWRKRFASTPAPGRLFAHTELEWVWLAVHQFLPVRFLDQHGIVTSLPPPRTVVRIMKRPASKSGVSLIYAPTLAGVTQPGVPAVIGRGSSKTRLELAVRGLDGTLYVLHGRVGSYIGVTFGAVRSLHDHR